VGLLGKHEQVHLTGQGHPPRMNFQDLGPVRLTRDTNLYLPVKPARSPEGGIDGIHPVGSSNDHHLSPLLEAIHHGKELCHYPPFHLTGHLFPPGSDRIKLIDEDDRGSIGFRFFEDLSQFLLTLPVVFGNDLRTCNRDEMGTALASHCLCYQGLSGSRRSVQENPFRGLNPEFLEEFRMTHREFDHLPHTLELILQSPDILI